MNRNIEFEINAFSDYIERIAARHPVKQLCSDVWKIEPSFGQDTHLPNKKTIALTLLALTHGNEVGGIGALNEFLCHLLASNFELQIPIVVGLGNPEAARQNRRYIDKDLNRSFLNSDNTTHEGKRARELEGVLKETYRFMDFHQTKMPTRQPFFIFPYTPEGLKFARGIDPRLTVVTHWGDSFSTDGGCTDEYINSVGGIGLSLELGQNGFDPCQIALGADAALWAHQSVTNHLRGKSIFRDICCGEKGAVYTWEKITPFPESGRPLLNSGWENFMRIEKGENIGENEGKTIIAEASGNIIFPCYFAKNDDLSKRPGELYRVMKKISVEDLPS